MVKTIVNELKKYKYYPEKEDLFKLYRLLAPQDVKLVILSQSPYPLGEADGIAFSSKRGVPKSLQVIQEAFDTKLVNLQPWVEQGVWLQNMILTCRPRKPLAHQNIGWERFVKVSLQSISRNPRLIWWLWGSQAAKFKSLAKPSHLVLVDSHPVNRKQEYWDIEESLEQVQKYAELHYGRRFDFRGEGSIKT